MVSRKTVPKPQSAGGVGIIAPCNVPFDEVPAQGDLGKKLWESGRFCHATLAYGEHLKSTLHVFCVYGHPNGWSDPHSRELNEALLRDIFEYAACFGDVPVLLLGDLNTTVDCSAQLAAAIDSHRWFDAAILQSQLHRAAAYVFCS